jgi:hypothetical protein
MKTKTYLNILLVAFLIFAAVPASSAASSPALLSLSSPVEAAGVSVQATGSPSTANPKGEPVTVWSLSWTSTKAVSSEASYPHDSFVESYNYNASGSTLYRVFADDTYDNINFKLHVADDYDSTTTVFCNKGGKAPDHAHLSNSDPNRYDGAVGGLLGNWKVQRYQDLDKNWWVSIHYPQIPGFDYAGTTRMNGSDCGGGTWDTTTPWIIEHGWNAKCIPITIQGNADGTEFTYHADGSDLYGGCEGPAAYAYGDSSAPYQVQWSADFRVQLLKARDLTVDRLEVTQGLQDGANSIPLVQGRRTVVRAFLGIGANPGPVLDVTGSLEGYAGAAKVGSLSPFNPNGKINAPSDPDWKNINDTLNFELPPEWTSQPALRLVVKVNPGRSVVEDNYDNNERSIFVSPLACNGISVGYLPVHYAPPAGAAADPGASIRVGQQFMQKIYPVSDTGLTYAPRGAITFMQNINDADADVALLESLRDTLAISSPPHPDRIFGWLPSLAYDDNGAAFVSGTAAFGNDTEAPDRWRRTFAHELGHNYGLRHPNPDLTTAGDHWFDVYDRVIKPVPVSVGGTDLLDFMVPARLEPEAWISPQNYKYLIGKLCSSAAGAASPGLSQVGDNLIVSGSIANTTPATGTLNPLFRLSTVTASDPLIGTQYCVDLKGVSANLLASYCFNLGFDGDSATPLDSAGFGMVIPYPTGLSRVELTETSCGTVLSSQVASAHAPSVSVSYPNAAGLTLSGSQTITWAGSDLDGNPLTYDVLYSRDNGGTWMGVGARITGTSFSLDFSTLPGTNGVSGLIKVLVSDGFHSAEDTSNDPFTVGNKVPLANILSPSTGAAFTPGPQIILDGSGVDFEDGSLSNSALSWDSSQDGALGTGRLLEVNLTAGTHTITLTVTDSGGLTSSASIQITVVEPAPMNHIFLPLIMR